VWVFAEGQQTMTHFLIVELAWDGWFGEHLFGLISFFFELYSEQSIENHCPQIQNSFHWLCKFLIHTP
jgi:hypothetical protein